MSYSSWGRDTFIVGWKYDNFSNLDTVVDIIHWTMLEQQLTVWHHDVADYVPMRGTKL